MIGYVNDLEPGDKFFFLGSEYEVTRVLGPNPTYRDGRFFYETSPHFTEHGMYVQPSYSITRKKDTVSKYNVGDVIRFSHRDEADRDQPLFEITAIKGDRVNMKVHKETPGWSLGFPYTDQDVSNGYVLHKKSEVTRTFTEADVVALARKAAALQGWCTEGVNDFLRAEGITVPSRRGSFTVTFDVADDDDLDATAADVKYSLSGWSNVDVVVNGE